MKQTVEVAIEYAGSVISSFGTNGVPNGISAIKEMIASGFKSGAEWRSKQSPWIKVSDGLPDVDDYYLVTDGESISMAYFFNRGNMKGRCGRPIEEVYGIYIGMIMTIIHQ